jgi:hypothetical protein
MMTGEESGKKSILERIFALDRRWIYLMIILVVIFPMLWKLNLPKVRITKEVQAIYDHIDKLGPDDCIILSVDYDPGVVAELQPMAKAVLHHAFKRGVKVIVTVYGPTGVGLAEEALNSTAPKYGRKSGVDYVFLGYRPLFHLAIMGMGEDSFEKVYPKDYYDQPLSELPMMKRINNAADHVDLAVSLAGSAACMSWVTYGHERYGLKVAFGVTAVMATDYYPYIQSGQLVGMMGGLKGAAEYERLVEQEWLGAAGMESQSIAHLLIIALIVFGNIGEFLLRGKKEKRLGG